jgi:hypothetical protein
MVASKKIYLGQFLCFSYPCFFWVSSLAYPNLLGTKVYVIVVVGCQPNSTSCNITNVNLRSTVSLTATVVSKDY